MQNLDQKYAIELDTIKGAIQSSDLLNTYLDDEEEESYTALREAFEPQIEIVFQKVAADNPLQLVGFEKHLLDQDYEGLYLSKVLGYTVLRGEVDELYRYKMPQDHFKEILLAICLSSNFELISKRIGQGVQIGFGLSSNIWITNLIEKVEFNRIKAFLQEQILLKYRDAHQRKAAFQKYQRQFASVNYYSAEFPKTLGELKVKFSSLSQFLMLRVKLGTNNDSLTPHIVEFLNNKEFKQSKEYVQLLHLFCNFYDFSGKEDWLKKMFNEQRKDHSSFNADYFEFHDSILDSDLDIGVEEDKKILNLIDVDVKDDLTKFYTLMDIIHEKGYVHDDVIEATRSFYDQHEGLSTINECLRKSTLNHFRRLLAGLSVETYTDYFEMNKVFAVYIQIFNNQQFNQDVKGQSLVYISKLLKTYTDKRGKDYQEIKKFITHTFLDLGFLNAKQLVELFKTRRKKKKPE
ncbi:MAG: hypothetical protein DRI69_01570 [Bacteroidetes bacterium]|nr:MAG: hypothetical protein DRI69_01570 [Bacteroidota bacterium]